MKVSYGIPPQVTRGPLPSEAQEMFDQGQDVVLHDLSNVAYPSPGYWVGYLVDYGLWEAKEFHLAHTGNWTRYGPKDVSQPSPVSKP